MKIKLPVKQGFKRDSENHHLYGWSDNYGAIEVAAEYCGSPIPMKYPYQWFNWSHGCYGSWRLVHPGLITLNLENKKLKYLVATKKDEIFLKNNGYPNVKAIGLPILYVKDIKIKRIPNSLLIMPSHTVRGDKKVDKEAYESYIDFIKPYLKYFSAVKVCLHSGCIANNMWVNEFTALGIEIIEGADGNDKNALLRQKYLFKQFDFITSNNWGSHIAYALFFGCKVSISGPFTPILKENFLRETAWKNNPETLELLFSDKVKAERNKILKHLYVNPNEGLSDVELGKQLIGFYEKKTPKQLLSIMKPTFTEILNYYLKRLR